MSEQEASPPEQEEEPVLTWHISRWQCDTHDKNYFVWLSDATLQRYIQDWLQRNSKGARATKAERIAAWEQVRKVSYWVGSHDPEVHITDRERVKNEYRAKWGGYYD